jgi:hypothetical protein
VGSIVDELQEVAQRLTARLSEKGLREGRRRTNASITEPLKRLRQSARGQSLYIPKSKEGNKNSCINSKKGDFYSI